MSDEEDGQMRDLFGSEDEDDQEEFGAPSMRAKQVPSRAQQQQQDDDDALVDDQLEDEDVEDAQPSRNRHGLASEDAEEDGAGASGDEDAGGAYRGRRRRGSPPARKSLAKTGAPIEYSAPLLPVPGYVPRAEPPSARPMAPGIKSKTNTLTSDELYLMREALIGIEPQPFVPESYQMEEELVVDDKGMTKVKPVDATKVRWRWVPAGEALNSVQAAQEAASGLAALGREHGLVPQSNSRLVRWSDGSVQLLLGEEVFDVVTADIGSQRSYMFALSGVIQGQAALTSKLGFRLDILNSKLYARMNQEVDKRTQKSKKVRAHVEDKDPAKEKERRAREEEEMMRNRLQMEVRQNRTMARYGAAPSGRARGGRAQLNTRFLEEDDGLDGMPAGDDDFIVDDDDDLGAPVGRGGGGRGGRRGMHDDDEDEAAQRLQRAKRAPPPPAGGGGKRRRFEEESEEEEDEEEYVESEGDDEGNEEEEEEEEEDPRAARAKAAAPKGGVGRPAPKPVAAAPKPKARRGVVMSDEED